MSWIIYQLCRDDGKRMYVTDICEGSVGHYSGPGELDQACEWDEKVDAQQTLDWLNDPETFYGPQTPHVLEEKP
jgi:hypothetical protein